MLSILAALALNAAVSQATIRTTICVPNWTDTVRPPVSYTDALKRKQLPPGSTLSAYEEDHVTPLCLGGHPTDPRNLRPQAWPDARRKDREETALCRAVCAGRITLRVGAPPSVVAQHRDRRRLDPSPAHGLRERGRHRRLWRGGRRRQDRPGLRPDDHRSTAR
jgi:hypothetical protein